MELMEEFLRVEERFQRLSEATEQEVIDSMRQVGSFDVTLHWIQALPGLRLQVSYAAGGHDGYQPQASGELLLRFIALMG